MLIIEFVMLWLWIECLLWVHWNGRHGPWGNGGTLGCEPSRRPQVIGACLWYPPSLLLVQVVVTHFLHSHSLFALNKSFFVSQLLRHFSAVTQSWLIQNHSFSESKSFVAFIILKVCVCFCEGICMWAQAPKEARGDACPWSGVTGSTQHGC